MAAYAALVSLMDLIEKVEHHPDPPLSLDQKQAKSLTEKISFLQGFLEDFHSRGLSQEMQALESRIINAAHAAEDVIESQILLASELKESGIESNGIDLMQQWLLLGPMWSSLTKRPWLPKKTWRNTPTDVVESQIVLASRFTTEDAMENTDVVESQILLGSRPTTGGLMENKTYEGLQRVIEDMELIEKEAANETKKKRSTFEDDNQLLPPRRGSSVIETTSMVGFDDICTKVMDRLTGNQSRRDIVPLVGMGGSGKTTLARNIYEKKLIVEHFHARSWATISQECVVREVLIEFLLCLSKQKREALNQKSEIDLGDRLYKSLSGRKYLIVIDDVWSIEAWDKLKFFFPDNGNGSRIMITTRLSKLAFDLSGSPGVGMDLLDEDTSWDLLCMKASSENSLPQELEEIGRTIARNCRGLPLSIVTIGGLLAKSVMTREYWEFIAKNLSSLVNSEDGERCLRILSLSYIHLPVHLKACFLYMGLFPEDERIQASHLIRLWVAEGFLKPINGKALEVVGEDYLKDLIERNLVSVDKWGSAGNISSCTIHDLLRDLCLREAQRERFFSVARIDNLHGIGNTQRRIAIHPTASNEEDSPHHGKPHSAPFMRSCIIDSEKGLQSISLRSAQFLKILAGLESYIDCDVDDIVPLGNLRFISINFNLVATFDDLSFFWRASWNLQTLVINAFLEDTATLDIWNMPQLRYVKCILVSIYLSDPPPSNVNQGQEPLVLENLHTLSNIINFKCSEEVIRRIPNIRKLRILYAKDERRTSKMDEYCLNNLERLRNLESLEIKFYLENSPRNWLDGLTLPFSLKKLSLYLVKLDNDTMSTMIGGSLPLLEVLKLNHCDFIGDEWNPVEGQFLRLKYLELQSITDLKYCNIDNSCIPCLEQLVIEGTHSLEEIPSGIGDIPTLRLICLDFVTESLIISAKQLLEEQEEQIGDVLLQIRVKIDELKKELLESFARNMSSSNLKIDFV